MILLANIVRGLEVAGAFFLVGAVLRVILDSAPGQRMTMPRDQRARFAGLVAAAAPIALGAVQHYGRPLTVFAPFFLAFLALEVYGVLGMRRRGREHDGS